MNDIIYLHNQGIEDDVYGSRLYMYCTKLANQRKVSKDFPNQIYVLSVDWPLDFITDFISKTEYQKLKWRSVVPLFVVLLKTNYIL